MDLKWIKILSLPPDLLPKNQMDTLKKAVYPKGGEEKMLQWEFHDDGRIDLYWKDEWTDEKT